MDNRTLRTAGTRGTAHSQYGNSIFNRRNTIAQIFNGFHGFKDGIIVRCRDDSSTVVQFDTVRPYAPHLRHAHIHDSGTMLTIHSFEWEINRFCMFTLLCHRMNYYRYTDLGTIINTTVTKLWWGFVNFKEASSISKAFS